MNKQVEQLRKEYQEIPIPEELDMIVNQAIRTSRKANRGRRTKYSWFAGVGAAAIIFLVTINASTSVANALSAIPGVDRIIKVLTLKEYTLDEPNFNANVKVPSIAHMDNKELESGLNEKYMKENKALFDKFQKEISELKKQGDGHMGLDAGYQVKTDNEDILSIERYVVESAASSSEELKLDTIDKKNQILITLPMLFKDERYIELISSNIKEQMRAQMKADPNKFYWVQGAADVLPTDEFKSITKDQSFYINNEGKLVIVFNKYDVAPGYMGAAEFVIPTEVLEGDLVSHKYIK
ncbi:RsiV family protein [Paenibacillus chibensis]|uniref:RsiV family protein n=1 Tax=Paenibacillus chibensis TaxID=59846 RepID=UPI000FD87FC4|nr:RsiV family protein [Paenibacillus chibensis]MEC0370269.1 RsiV family protein [Paenibacillus chibensis]